MRTDICSSWGNVQREKMRKIYLKLAHGHNFLQAPSIVRALLQMSPTHVLYMCVYIYIYMHIHICLYMYSGYEGMDGPVGLLICGLVCLCVCVVV